jgi:hypothetical protein
MQIDVTAFEYAISKIEDGFIFESFAQQFLSAVLGYGLIPVGGSKDKGIDAYQHIYQSDKLNKTIFQMSTESTWDDKIIDTFNKLKSNKVSFDRLFYVTNRKLNNTDKYCEDFFEHYKINLTIYDIRWFSSNCNANEGTIKTFHIFSEKYLHEFSTPGKTSVIANLDSDSRLFVFLRQQFDKNRNDSNIEDLLIDTLILYSLEGTDPDKNILLTKSEIHDKIQKYIKFDLRLLEDKLDSRLSILSTKPRKIKFHTKLEGYCLPYETRVEIQNRNLNDNKLIDEFNRETIETIKKYLKDAEISIHHVNDLLNNVLNKIYYQQGLEFSNFVLLGDSKSIIEQNLADVISSAVESSSVVNYNKEKVKTALQFAIREIVYQGSTIQLSYLKSLSNTYLMMYLLHWEPKISTYFNSMASKLKVFVDNSIIIPALSEIYLEDKNRRHWNLLVSANKAGIALYINETLLNELVYHIKMVKNIYQESFLDKETYYIDDEYELLYVKEILLRAYLYSKKRDQVRDFDSFLDNFVDPSLRNVKEELIQFLKETFGIMFISNAAWDIKINPDDLEKLCNTLSPKKSADIKARNDAAMILSIYYLRDRDSESTKSSIFGYMTWWLSKDTSTYEAVCKAFGDRFPISCYIRPDFIYNYITLLPTVSEVETAYSELFPTMLGVNLSYHMPEDAVKMIQHTINEFHTKQPVRIKQIIRNLSEKLKSDPNVRNRNSIQSFFDEELKKINDIDNV